MVAGARTQLDECPGEGDRVHEREQHHPEGRADGGAETEPVRDRRVVRVERGEDDVHVGERRDRQDDIGHPPAPGDRGEDDGDREERVAVALVDAGRHHEEVEREDGEPDEQRQPVRAAGDGDEDHPDRREQERRADDDRRDPPEHCDPGPAVSRGAGVVADPQPGRRQALTEVARDEGPRVVCVDGQVRVAAGRDRDLLEQPRRDERWLGADGDHRQPERQAQDHRRQEAREPGREDPDRSAGALPVPEPPGRPQGAPDRDDGDERDEDTELGLDDRGDDRVDRRPLGPSPPQLSQSEHQEDDAERVHLAPYDAVEPADRVQHRDGCGGESEAVAPTELADHRPREVADGEVGQDRRHLDQVADAPAGAPDGAAEPQHVQVTRRVVVEEVATVEAAQTLIGEVRRPEPEGVEVDLEAGTRQKADEDEAEEEADDEDHEDGAHGSLPPGQRRRRSCASLGPAVREASHQERLLHERGKVGRSVAQGRAGDPGRGIKDYGILRTMTQTTVAGDDRIRTRLLPALLVAIVAFVAAWVALLPGVAFWDTGELQTVAPLMGTAHPPGFPTYVLLGWLASILLQPFGEPAFRMNLFSAICVAVAAGVTVDLVRKVTGWAILGIAAGIGRALTPIAWAIATHAEAHSLPLALFAILLWLLVTWEERVAGADKGEGHRGDRYLLAAAIVFGLAVGNHSLTLLLAVPVGLYVLSVDPRIWRRGRLVLTCVAALTLTIVLVYLELPLRAGPFRAGLVYGTPNTWDGFRYIVLAEQFQGSLSDPFGELPRKAGELITRTITQFGVLAPLIPVGFVVTALRRPRYALLTGTAVAITCFFNASYVNADINRYYLGPVLIAWTWLAILAAVAIELLASAAGEPPLADPGHQPQGTAAAADSDPDAEAVDPGWAVPGPRATAIAIVISIALLLPTVLDAPARYAAVDQKGQHAAETWVDRVLGEMEPDSVVVSWWSYSTPLWYEQRVLGKRPDITIVDDRTRLDENLGEITDVIDANLGQRPVYVLRLDQREVALLAARYELEYIDGTDATSLTKVIAKKAI